LAGAEDDGFLILVDFFHEELDAIALSLFDFDDAVEVGLAVGLFCVYIAFEEVIIRAVAVFVQTGLELADFEGGEVAVVDAGFEGIAVDGVAEVGVGVGVVFALGRCGEAELDGGFEVVEDVAPTAFIFCSASVAFVDDDEVEECGWVVAEVRDGVAVGVFACGKGLEDGEEDAAVFGDAALFSDGFGVDADEGVIGEGGEAVEGLVGEDVAVGEEEDAGAAFGLRVGLAAEVPTAVEEFPGNLEGDGGFAGAGGHGEEDAIAPFTHGIQDMLNGVVLIIPGFPGAAAVFEGDGGEAVTPLIFTGKGFGPEFVGAGVGIDIGFSASFHVDLVDAEAVGGVGEADFEFFGVVFGLADAFGVVEVSLFGFDDSEFVAFVGEDVVGKFGGGASAVADEATGGDYFAADAAAWGAAPACAFEGGVD